MLECRAGRVGYVRALREACFEGGSWRGQGKSPTRAPGCSFQVCQEK